MPQMAPYNWLYLNMMITMIFLINMTFLHFMPLNFSPIQLNHKIYNKNLFNFKW